MSTTATVARPQAAARQRRPKTPGGATLGQGASAEARRLAAAILEVLAGERTPAQAATALSLSLPRYYQVESQALRGLLAACEPRPKGRVRTAAGELTTLRQEHERLKRALARQQTLVRLTQRTAGLAPPAPAPAKTGGKKRRPRRPAARALHVAARLQQATDAPEPAGPEALTTTP
jgi:hypothetical protein